jgi:hypothetical protein
LELNELVTVSDLSFVDIDHGPLWRIGKGIICIRFFGSCSENDFDLLTDRLGSTIAVGRDGTKEYILKGEIKTRDDSSVQKMEPRHFFLSHSVGGGLDILWN